MRRFHVNTARALHAGTAAAALVTLASWTDAGAFQIRKTAQSGGATESASTSYSLRGTVSESSAVGEVSSASFQLRLGFWPGHYASSYVVDAPDAGESGPTVQYVNGLRQNFPNPFQGTTAIHYSVAQQSPVRLQVFDVTGRRVATIQNLVREPGRYRTVWDGRDNAGRVASSGVYFYRLDVGSWSRVKKLTKLR